MPAGNPSFRVLVISARRLVRAGLVALVRGQPQIGRVDEQDDPPDTMAEYDVALWDAAGAAPRPLPFQVLALVTKPADARDWLDAGAAGCILETAAVEELLGALRQVARGELFLSPPIVQQLVSCVKARAATSEPDAEPLTDRERDVLQLLTQGLGNKDIAQQLYLSVRTVEGHLANIYSKLHVKSRTEAVLWAVEHVPRST